MVFIVAVRYMIRKRLTSRFQCLLKTLLRGYYSCHISSYCQIVSFNNVLLFGILLAHLRAVINICSKSYKEAPAKMMLRYALKCSDFHEDKETILIKLYGHTRVFAVFQVYANIKSCNFAKKSFSKIVTEKKLQNI